MSTQSNSPAPSVAPAAPTNVFDFSSETPESIALRQKILAINSLKNNLPSTSYQPLLWVPSAGSFSFAYRRVMTPPSFTNTILIRRSGYLVTMLADGTIGYFKCPPLKEEVNPNDLWFYLAGPAPILQESLFIRNKEVYLVSERDLRRRRIRKSSRLQIKKTTVSYDDIISGNLSPIPSSRSRKQTSGASAEASAVRDLGPDPNDNGTGPDSALAELEAINLAFSEQVRALLGATSEEEIEWQTPENPQPQPSNAASPVQNTDPPAE